MDTLLTQILNSLFYASTLFPEFRDAERWLKAHGASLF